MTWTPANSRRNHWALTLTPEQRAAVKRVRATTSAIGGDEATEGWSVYMTPTTGPAKYVELRHYLTTGRIARWVIERDGTVSATNARGQSRELIAA